MSTWYSLSPTYTASNEELENGIHYLSPSWKLLLQGDGSPTRHLRLLTGKKTIIDLLDYSILRINELDFAPPEIVEITGPVGRRQVWLCSADGERLGYAVSWWNNSKMNEFMNDTSKPIGTIISSKKRELYRDIRSVFLGHSDALEEAFGYPGPFWGRLYLFWNNGQPLTMIYEVFSPSLNKYLGNPIPTTDESMKTKTPKFHKSC